MKYNDKFGDGVRIFAFILLIIFLAILSGNVLRLVFGGSSFTFSSFLAMLSEVPQIPIRGMQTFNITADWGVIDFIRHFLNAVMMPLNLTVFISANLWNCLLYIMFFVKFLFAI